MQFSFIDVDLSFVDHHDQKFRISEARDVSGLARSIERAGLINSPILQEKINGGYRIVSGFARIAACRLLDMQSIPARIVDPGSARLDCAIIAVTENSSQRDLNLLEQSRAIAMIAPDLPMEERFPLLKRALLWTEPPNHRRLMQIESLCSLPDFIQEGVGEGTMAFPMAMALKEMSEDEARAFASLFARFRLSLGKQREVVSLVKEISVREDLSVMDVMECSDVKAVVNDQDLDGNAKARTLRAYLRKRRFPELTRAEKAYEQEVKGLKIPKGVRLTAPPGFEGDIYELRISFRKIEDLAVNEDLVKRLVKEPGLEKILSR